MASQEEMEMRLFYLAATGDLSGTKKLIECGVSIHATDYNSRCALHLASERGHLEVVEYLTTKGADIDCKDNLGETPLTLATGRGHRLVQEALVKAGASLQSRNFDIAKAKRCMHASFAVMEAFPQPIAMAMLEGRKIEPISKSAVSLFFSDIVGFTNLSSTMEPGKVSSLLNRLFRKFDRLAYMHGIQKVDTVGDAYIAAANFMEEQSIDHAARLTNFAIDAIKAAHGTLIDEDEEDEESQAHVKIRIGLHSGPVSGSVIGSQNLKYTLLGDAVNVASRMESTGSAGRIQCSEACAALIAEQADDVILTRREGGVDVKGKGLMHTFWVSSARRKSLHSVNSLLDFAPADRARPRRASAGCQEEDHPGRLGLASDSFRIARSPSAEPVAPAGPHDGRAPPAPASPSRP